MPINTKIHSGGLADNAVSTDKIAGDAVTVAKVADNAVTNAKVADDAVGIAELATNTGITTTYHKVPAFVDDAARDHNTTGIPSPVVGMLIYNTSKGVVQQYNAQGWASVDSPPTISSIDYPGSTTALDPIGEKVLASSTTVSGDATVTVSSTTGLRAGMTAAGTISGTSCIPASTTISSVTNSTTLELSANATASGSGNVIMTFNTETLVITGSNFSTGVSVTIDNTAPSTVTRNSSSQITITGMPAKTAGTYADGLKVTNSSGLAASTNVDYSGFPAWQTASGNVLSAFITGSAISTVDLDATSATSYAYTGSLPPGLSMSTSTGDITGTITGTTYTTYNFTVTATDAEAQSAPRLFNIITAALPTGGIISSPTGYKAHVFKVGMSESFSFVLAAPLAIDWLVVGGGGGGAGQMGAGGGAGGFRTGTNYTLPTGTYTIVVGTGGAGGEHGNVDGADDGLPSQIKNSSNTILIQSHGGGGGGGYGDNATKSAGHDGGSGGGGASGTSSGSFDGGDPIALNPARLSGEVGTVQGYAGGTGTGTDGTAYTGGGGGGAGQAGETSPNTTRGGKGGDGENNVMGMNDADSDAFLTTLSVGHDASDNLRYFAGGGSGTDYPSPTYQTASKGGGGSDSVGVAHTGGGGSGKQSAVGYAGGSGIVIIRYAV